MTYIVAILKFVAVLFVGYFVCFMVALLWVLGAFTPRFNLEALPQGILFVLIMGMFPITLSTVSVSIVAVAMRRHPFWLQLCGSTAMSLMVPCFLLFTVATPPQGRPDRFSPMLFLPPACAALGMVGLTRALFPLKKSLPPVASSTPM